MVFLMCVFWGLFNFLAKHLIGVFFKKNSLAWCSFDGQQEEELLLHASAEN